jgi:2-dehydropantoate 2-reductase
MNILVMGAGALGSAIGGFLAKSGNNVSLIGREKHISAINQNGLKISGIWGEHLVKNLKTSVNSVQDVILLTTKSTDTIIAAKEILPYIGENTLIISLQNGVGNEQILQEICGKKHVLGGMVIIGFEMVDYGHVKVTVFADKVKIGEMDHTLSLRVKDIVSVFNEANIPTEAVDNINQHLWGKLLYNSCLNPLGALLNVKYGELKNENTWRIIQDIIKEAFLVTKAAGIELLWGSASEYEEVLSLKQIPPTKDHRPSMLQDIEKGRKTEIDFLNGKIVSLGKEYGISTPVNSMLCELIRFKEGV